MYVLSIPMKWANIMVPCTVTNSLHLPKFLRPLIDQLLKTIYYQLSPNKKALHQPVKGF